MMYFCELFFSIILCFVILIILYRNHKLSYWKNRNVINIKDVTLTGTSKELKELYNDFKAKGIKYFGHYSYFGHPLLMILDEELIKRVTTTDFEYFNSRDTIGNAKDNPLTMNLFSSDGKEWKHLRSKLTPTFSSGKMKLMVPLIVKCAKIMESNLLKKIQNEKCIEMNQLFCSFAIDVIGTVAFGIDCNGFDENSPFTKFGNAIKQSSKLSYIKREFMTAYPTITKHLILKKKNAETTYFFINLVRDIVEHREKNCLRRNDFMQILIDLKNSNEEIREDSPFTLNDIASEVFIFFYAGFETVSNTLAFCLYELALNEEIQKKLRNDINKILQKHNGQITYEILPEMKYLGQVIDETLRKYPTAVFLNRKCTQNYKIPDSNLIIEEGVKVTIPAYRIHYDSKYYNNPEKFDPDRFSIEEKENLTSHAYMPFGAGPRICIASRFALMETKIAISTLISKYHFTIDEERMPKTLKFDPYSKTFRTEHGFYMNVRQVCSDSI